MNAWSRCLTGSSEDLEGPGEHPCPGECLTRVKSKGSRVLLSHLFPSSPSFSRKFTKWVSPMSNSFHNFPGFSIQSHFNFKVILILIKFWGNSNFFLYGAWFQETREFIFTLSISLKRIWTARPASQHADIHRIVYSPAKLDFPLSIPSLYRQRTSTICKGDARLLRFVFCLKSPQKSTAKDSEWTDDC